MSSGIRIRDARKAAGHTLESLGNAIDVSGSAIQQWEKDETSPKGANLTKLCSELKVTEEWILFGRGNGPNSIQETRGEYKFDSTYRADYIREILAGMEEGLANSGKDMEPQDKSDWFMTLLEVCAKEPDPKTAKQLVLRIVKGATN